LWGNKSQFLNALKNSLETYDREDKDYRFTSYHSLRIKFSKAIFEILFIDNCVIDFNKSIGERLEYEDNTYLQLIESPCVNFATRIEKSKIINVPRKCVVFFINENKSESLYYPEEIAPLFIYQLKERLIVDYTFSTDTEVYTNFCSLFRPMKYILRIKKDKHSLQEKLLYKLCINLGLIEYEKITTSKLEVSQDINQIYDLSRNSILLTDTKKQINLELRFYTSAMKTTDPIYQFLELYHILESYFYKYFYNYIKNLKQVKTKKDYEEVRTATKEEKMLKLVLKDISTDFNCIHDEFEKIRYFRRFCKDVLNRNNINHANWDASNIDTFSEKLSDFIYSLRNNIVHTKESDKTIRIKNLNYSEKNVLMKVNNILFFIVQRIFDKNIEW